MEENKENRPWYKKKRYSVPLVLVGLFFVLGLSNSLSNQQFKFEPVAVSSYKNIQPVEVNTNVESITVKSAIPAIVSPKPTTNNDSTVLSNNGHYINVDGNTVHSPAYSNSVPAGASAKCRDGTYSFSQNRRGTCSHHGGVARWY